MKDGRDLSRKTLLTVMLAFAFGAPLGASAQAPDFDKWRDCSQDSDCVLVETPCRTPDSVARKYASEHRLWTMEAAKVIECMSPQCCLSAAFETALKQSPGQGPRCCGGRCIFLVSAEARATLPEECNICGKTEACQKPA